MSEHPHHQEATEAFHNWDCAVVVCALNGAATLPRQLDSITAEITAMSPSLRCELVLVNNGSTDRTQEIYADYAARFSFIKVVDEPIRGPNRARNTGVRAATAPKILLCDADDEVLNGWLEAMSSLLDQYDLVGCDLEMVTPEGVSIRNPTQPRETPVFWGLNSPWGCACGFTRETWDQTGGFVDHLPWGTEEVEFFIGAQNCGFTLGWIERPLVRYYRYDSPERAKSRSLSNAVCGPHMYWYWRVRGWPRQGRPLSRTVWLALFAPKALFSQRFRSEWVTSFRSHMIRLRSAFVFGVPMAWAAWRSGEFRWALRARNIAPQHRT